MVRTLVERSIQVQQGLNLCFVDYSKAFDNVQHKILFKMLTSLDLAGKDSEVLGPYLGSNPQQRDWKTS